MNDPTNRTLAPLDTFHLNPAELVVETVRAVEGVVQQGQLSVQVLMVTEELVMLKVWRKRD